MERAAFAAISISLRTINTGLPTDEGVIGTEFAVLLSSDFGTRRALARHIGYIGVIRAVLPIRAVRRRNLKPPLPNDEPSIVPEQKLKRFVENEHVPTA